jgi:hypothetical protein
MQKYIEHLIEDIRAGKKYVPEVKPETDDYDEFEKNMMDLENSPDITPGTLFHLNKEMFPPVEKLTDSQLETLTEEILSLWAEYTMDAVYPENLPARILYPMLVAKLEEPVQYWPGWTMGVEFCSYEPENCPFGHEYCTCKDFQDEWEAENNHDEMNPDSLREKE